MKQITSMAVRLKEYRERFNLTLADLSNKTGVPAQTLNRYELGQRAPKIDVAIKIADALNINPLWIQGYDSPIEKKSSPSQSWRDSLLPPPRMVKKPRLGTIACGTPILAVENIDEYDMVPEDVHCDFTLKCKGDSMINARIYDGDIVYIRRQDTIENGEIAAVLIDEEATLKRIRLFDDHISLDPENPLYRPLVYWGEEMNAVHILGKAVAFTSTIR